MMRNIILDAELLYVAVPSVGLTCVDVDLEIGTLYVLFCCISIVRFLVGHNVKSSDAVNAEATRGLCTSMACLKLGMLPSKFSAVC
ncbi:hypothetical protein L2E82_18448 [Cichorium intybus]|uniref:Uncharacterized protein n=1 Tax=Cichorium intybus TaxID=13427 RepID=A0ACB9FA53_CICIN|nr:hypothetical protein L2E82_18448 [Cichorium intybus]